jgi:hypothetical protein
MKIDAFLSLASAVALMAVVALVMPIAYGSWHPSKAIALTAAALIPCFHLLLFSALVFVRRRMQADRFAGLLSATAHALCLTAALFLILYAGTQMWLLPLQVLILPALSVVLGWAVVLPLAFVAFARSKLWLDLVPVPCYIGIAMAGWPVLITST